MWSFRKMVCAQENVERNDWKMDRRTFLKTVASVPLAASLPALAQETKVAHELRQVDTLTFIGSGNMNGPFVHTGRFKPKQIIIKDIDAVSDWREYTLGKYDEFSNHVRFYSNGFKISTIDPINYKDHRYLVYVMT
jgi:hypothetical protein